jgi:hypothetical protein
VSFASGVLNVSTLTLNTTHAVSGLGFQPTWVLVWCSGRTEGTDTNGAASHDWCAGFACAGITQRTLSTQSFNGNTTMGADATIRDDCMIAMLNHALAGGTDNGRIALLTFDSGGFTVKNITALSRALRLCYICGDSSNQEIGTITEPGSTGNQTVTMANSFQPDLLVFLGSCIGTINTVDVDSNFSIGFCTGTGSSAQWVLQGGSDDALGTSNVSCYAKTGEVLALSQATPPTTPGTTNLSGRAGVNAISVGSFQLNWSERAGSRLIFYLAVKGGSYAAGKLALANTSNGATNAVTGLGFQPTGLFVGFPGFTAECTADTPVTSQEIGMGAGSSASNRGVRLHHR